MRPGPSSSARGGMAWCALVRRFTNARLSSSRSATVARGRSARSTSKTARAAEPIASVSNRAAASRATSPRSRRSGLRSGRRAKLENSLAMWARLSIWSTSISVVRSNAPANFRASGGSSSAGARKMRRRCCTLSFMGISGFLISCATCRAISRHANSRSCSASWRRDCASCACMALNVCTSSPTSSRVSTGMGSSLRPSPTARRPRCRRPNGRVSCPASTTAPATMARSSTSSPPKRYVTIRACPASIAACSGSVGTAAAPTGRPAESGSAL